MDDRPGDPATGDLEIDHRKPWTKISGRTIRQRKRHETCRGSTLVMLGLARAGPHVGDRLPHVLDRRFQARGHRFR